MHLWWRNVSEILYVPRNRNERLGRDRTNNICWRKQETEGQQMLWRTSTVILQSKHGYCYCYEIHDRYSSCNAVQKHTTSNSNRYRTWWKHAADVGIITETEGQYSRQMKGAQWTFLNATRGNCSSSCSIESIRAEIFDWENGGSIEDYDSIVPNSTTWTRRCHRKTFIKAFSEWRQPPSWW